MNPEIFDALYILTRKLYVISVLSASLIINAYFVVFADPYTGCPSTFHLTGLTLNSGDYLGARAVSSLGDLHPATAAAAAIAANSLTSTDFHFSVDGSRLSSSRAGSIRASISRKRALSSSPYSDSFDINSMIRFSPNSLAAIMNGSRSSSTASGSYGHLSTGSISPVPHLQQLQAHLLRASAGLLHPMPSHPAATSMFAMGHMHPLQSAAAAAAAVAATVANNGVGSTSNSGGLSPIKRNNVSDTVNTTTPSNISNEHILNRKKVSISEVSINMTVLQVTYNTHLSCTYFTIYDNLLRITIFYLLHTFVLFTFL